MSLLFNAVSRLVIAFFPRRKGLLISWLQSPSAMHLGSIPGSGRSPGEGNGYPLQYSYLVNSMDRRALWATVHGVANSQMQWSD